MTEPASTRRMRVSSTASSRRRSWVTSKTVPGNAPSADFELLDGGNVQVVRGLVEHERVHTRRLQQCQRGAGALTGGQRAGRAQHVLGAEAELGQHAASVAERGTGSGDERVEQAGVPRELPRA